MAISSPKKKSLAIIVLLVQVKELFQLIYGFINVVFDLSYTNRCTSNTIFQGGITVCVVPKVLLGVGLWRINIGLVGHISIHKFFYCGDVLSCGVLV